MSVTAFGNASTPLQIIDVFHSEVPRTPFPRGLGRIQIRHDVPPKFGIGDIQDAASLFCGYPSWDVVFFHSLILKN